jgi:hypothetical protein
MDVDGIRDTLSLLEATEAALGDYPLPATRKWSSS